MGRRLRYLVELAGPTIFVTLTCNTRAHPEPRAAYAAMNRAFPDFIKRLRRDYPNQPVEYLAVWEATKAGWPHLHVLFRAPFLPKSRLSRYWSELMQSPIVDVEAVGDGRGAARYLAKYLTKGLQAPPGIRRWRASAKFFTEPFRPGAGRSTTFGNVTIARESMHDVLWSWLVEGWLPYIAPDGTGAAFKPGAGDIWHMQAHREWSSLLAFRRYQRDLARGPDPPE